MRVDGLTPILDVTEVEASLCFAALGWEGASGIREFHLRHLDGHSFRVGCETG